MGRPKEHTAATRAQLLETASRLLAEEGPGALGLRTLSARANTTTRAVYSLFGSKENLVRALYVTGFTELVDRLRAVPRTGDARVDLLAGCAAYRAHAHADPARYRLMCERLVPEFEPTCADREQAFSALVVLAALIEGCRESGDLTPARAVERPAGSRYGVMPPLPVDPQLELLTRQWWAVLHGLTALELRGLLGSPEEATAVWEATLAALLRPAPDGS